ncbi:MAG: Tex family protein [Bacillota bacterium]|nr:Tex family protein [Bacillota bacterium]
MVYHKEEKILKNIAVELKLDLSSISKVVALLDEGNTIPFIARYRKEISGGMTDEELRLLTEKLALYRNLEKRREDIHRLLSEQGVLTPELEVAVGKAVNVTELDDIYRPYRPKKRTRASMAREKGLEPLALLIMEGIQDPLEEAGLFLDEEKGVLSVEDALEGASDIIAETVSDNPRVRQALRSFLYEEGIMATRSKKKTESSYDMYYNFQEPLKKIQPHRVLAINRGEKEEYLSVKIEIPEEEALYIIKKYYIKNGFNSNVIIHLEDAVQDSWKRLLFPSLEREMRNDLTQKAEEQAQIIFKENLKGLLMVPPIKGKRILAIDPGLRTGCKIACVDETGNLLEVAIIYPTPPRSDKEKAAKVVIELMEKHSLNAIVIGNGTGGRETEEFVVEALSDYGKEIEYAVVNEAGASVYSASKLGREEFPELDVAERSAVSIARRVQDPLAELVKIDPRSIGVGQYQHDVNQKTLAETLSGVVESCVNQVGVNLNTSSPALLERVAGINKTVANNIAAYRRENGSFKSRKELKKVPKLGPTAFKQCAGFLRIPEAEHYFDRSAVHPESYDTAEKIMAAVGITPDKLGRPDAIPPVDIKELAAVLQVGELTLVDILDEFKKPGRDPREDLPKPVFKKGILNLEDLKEGMELQGIVRNVVDFGAFIDVGVHQDGLAHISELSDRYVKHPLDVVRVGDVVNARVLAVDAKKKRISLSLKTEKKI